jgi:hypothetical protein
VLVLQEDNFVLHMEIHYQKDRRSSTLKKFKQQLKTSEGQAAVQETGVFMPVRRQNSCV